MRIGIDMRSLMDAHPTGVGTYGRAVVRELLRQGTDHEFRLYASGLRGTLDTKALGVDQHPRTRLIWVRRPSKVLSLSTVALHRPVIDETLGGVDVFFSPNVNFTALSARAPLVLTVHDLTFVRFPELFSRWRNVWHRAVRARTLAGHATHLICDSQSTANDVAYYLDVPRERLSVVPLAVEDAPFASDKSTPELPASLKLGDQYIVAVGTIEPRKNFAQLIQAFDAIADRHPSCSLVIVGPRGWRRGAFSEALKQSQHRARIHVVGFLTDAQRRALVRNATLLCAPSTYEGFGLPLLEAMQVGTPVVTSNVSSMPEVGRDGVVYVNPERPAELAAALALLLRDDALRASLAERGRAIASEYSWHKTGQQTLAILQAVVENRTWAAQSGVTLAAA